MATIYVVTRGSYDDYVICAPFDDRALAELAVAACSTTMDDARIEEWELNKGAANLRNGLSVWWVYFSPEGAINHVIRQPELDLASPSVWVGDYPKGNMTVGVLAKDADQAGQVAQDKRAEYLASKAGVA